MVQGLLNSLYASSQYALIAVGLTLIYSVARFLNFAHGAVYVIGAYAMFCFTSLGLPIIAAATLGVLTAGLAGTLIDLSTYRFLRREGASSLEMLLASLGVFVVIQSVISLVFHDNVKIIRTGIVTAGTNLFGGHLTTIQIVGLLGSVVLLGVTYGVLRFSVLGRQARAIASDADLARAVGVNIDVVTSLIVLIGSLLAGFAATINAYDIDIRPTMGFYPLLMGVVAMLIGGVGRTLGAILAAIFVGVVQQVSSFYLPTQWQDSIVFFVLILFLLFRPQGFLGQPLRKAQV